MIKKKSITLIVALLLLFLSCGMCVLCSGCAEDGATNMHVYVRSLHRGFYVGDTMDVLNFGQKHQLNVQYTFGYDIVIGDREYSSGEYVIMLGWEEAFSFGVRISGFNTSSPTRPNEKRYLSISFLNKTCVVEYTVVPIPVV